MEGATNIESVIARFKAGTETKSDTELGRALGLGQQSVSNARIAGKVPDSWIRKAAERFNLSMDWLLFGEGAMHRGESGSAPPPFPPGAAFPPDVVFIVVEALEEFLQAQQDNLPPSVKAEVVRQLCQMLMDMDVETIRPGQMFRLIQGALSKAE